MVPLVLSLPEGTLLLSPPTEIFSWGSTGRPPQPPPPVRNSLQPQYINRAAHQAGAAGEAGEAEKDARHVQQVEEAGGLFFSPGR